MSQVVHVVLEEMPSGEPGVVAVFTSRADAEKCLLLQMDQEIADGGNPGGNNEYHYWEEHGDWTMWYSVHTVPLLDRFE